uniref:Ig-like domain-containing protein n=1 Tax=Oryctolagus cuniculus TaxID=9986 RepID=A0A5F9DB88_RABIT
MGRTMRTLAGPFFLFLWLQLHCVSRGETVEQSPSFLSVQEGDSCVINCTYTDSASTYFFWYKQEPGSGLQFLINILSSMEKKEEQRLTVLMNEKDKHLSLRISVVHVADSAVYFCAALAQPRSGTCSLYPKPAEGLFQSFGEGTRRWIISLFVSVPFCITLFYFFIKIFYLFSLKVRVT